MATQPVKRNKWYFRFFAFLTMCLALTATTIGVTHWPILLYAAAPCFFLAFVLYFAAPSNQQMNVNEHEPMNGNGWFCARERTNP